MQLLMSKKNTERLLAASLFPIEGFDDTSFEFRLLRVREAIPKDNFRPIRMQKWADRLWRRELRCPVYPTEQFGFPGFLIPSENCPSEGTSIEIKDVPDAIYHVDLTEQKLEVSLKDAKGIEKDLVSRMIERPFSTSFQRMRNKYWRDQWTLYFRLNPENVNNTRDVVFAYRGIKFSVIILGNSQPYFAADIRTKYLGKKSLDKYSDDERKDILRNHLDTTIKIDQRATFLRDNGTVKIPCRYTGETTKSVEDCTFGDEKESVFDYYKRQYKNIRLNPKEMAVFVNDRKGAGPSIPVPISRLFPVFTTDYQGIRRCSVRAQMTPEDRINNIGSILLDLNNVTYGNRRITVSHSHIVQERTVFLPPNLEFGKDKVIKPFEKGSPPPRSNPKFDSQISRWGSRKMPTLYSSGPFHNETIPEVVLLYPQTTQRKIREGFIKNLTHEINRQTGKNISVVQQESYSIGNAERMGSSLLYKAAEIKSQRPRSLAIVILWRQLSESVHGELKKVISPVLSQCLSERTANSINYLSDQRAVSQLRNLALAILTEAGVKPWVIADDLHYDMYIGIDTLYDTVGYHFLYGRGGRLIEREFGESAIRGRWKVAVKRLELRRRLVQTISTIIAKGITINSVVIHKDGRWWQSESIALKESMEQLISDGFLSTGVAYAAVEVRKNHLPVRLFTYVNEAGKHFLQNPLPGSYFILDNNKALLTTTGRPGAWDRRGISAGSILLEIAEKKGNVKIKEIARDAYQLTHLNWNAPDIEISVPVTIRWTDEALRETLQPPESDADDK